MASLWGFRRLAVRACSFRAIAAGVALRFRAVLTPHWPPSQVRPVVVRASETATNGVTVSATGSGANMMAFDDLSEIIKCAGRGTLGIWVKRMLDRVPLQCHPLRGRAGL